MQLDPEYLRQYYGSLSDDALLAVDRDELVEVARAIFDREVHNRKLVQPEKISSEPDLVDDVAEFEDESERAGENPDWLDDAAKVYAYAVSSAGAGFPAAADAREALAAAKIPCYIDFCEIQPEKSLFPYGTHRWRVLVPGKLSLPAENVLHRAIGNLDFEAAWKTHLEALSDEELVATDPQGRIVWAIR
jgi:hypothetical protein